MHNAFEGKTMDRANHALIVVDVQNDFCPGGALAVSGGDQIIPRINALMHDHPIVVLTQDWHPPNHSSFAQNHPGAQAFSTVQMPYGPQVLWPAHCVWGSAGAQFHPHLHTDPADLILRKGFRPEIDSYSAFFENDQTTVTGLEGYLRARGVKHVSFAGLATDFCVAWSALDAVRLGFGASVLMQACRAIDLNGSLAAAQETLRAAGVNLES
jgi:nicotinamidase/pyrazinamidase